MSYQPSAPLLEVSQPPMYHSYLHSVSQDNSSPNLYPVVSQPGDFSTSSSENYLSQLTQRLLDYQVVVLTNNQESINPYWGQVVECLQMLASIASPSDIRLYFSSHPFIVDVTGDSKVEQLLDSHRVSPQGTGYLTSRIKDILKQHLQELTSLKCQQIKPLQLVILTDHLMGNIDILRMSLCHFCEGVKKLGLRPRDCLGLHFFQIGRDPVFKELIDSLRTNLEHSQIIDDLAYNPRLNWDLKYGVLTTLIDRVRSDVIVL